jgi:hypothetical protein
MKTFQFDHHNHSLLVFLALVLSFISKGSSQSGTYIYGSNCSEATSCKLVCGGTSLYSLQTAVTSDSGVTQRYFGNTPNTFTYKLVIPLCGVNPPVGSSADFSSADALQVLFYILSFNNMVI